MLQPDWKATIDTIKETVPQAQFQNWFKPLEYLRSDDKTICLGVPSRFHEQWLLQNYAEQLTRAIRKNFGNELQLEFEILVREENEEASKSPTVTLPTPPPARPTLRVIDGNRHEEEEAPHPEALKPNFPTFETSFLDSEFNNVAFQCAQLFADGKDRKLNPLIFYGGVGMGKTHLLSEIGERALQRNPNLRVRYTNFETFTAEMVQGFKTNTSFDFKQKYRMDTDILLFDDIQGLAGRMRTQEELLHIFNELSNRGGQVAFTTAVPVQRLEQFIEPLKSRLLSGVIAEIKYPSFEEKVQLLGRVCYQNQMNIEPTVLRTIADKGQKDIRELIGSLFNAHLVARMENRPLNNDFLAREGWIREAKKEVINMEEIISLVEHNFAISRQELCSKSRKSLVNWARQVAMYLGRRYTQLALEDIGKIFGRDHATVIHSYQKVTDTMKEHPTRGYQVEFLIQKLEARSSRSVDHPL